MSGYLPLTAPTHRPVQVLDPPAPAVCDSCGATLAPNGACLEIGACERADADAARLSRVGATAKYVAAPAAWTGSGRVD